MSRILRNHYVLAVHNACRFYVQDEWESDSFIGRRIGNVRMADTGSIQIKRLGPAVVCACALLTWPSLELRPATPTVHLDKHLAVGEAKDKDQFDES